MDKQPKFRLYIRAWLTLVLFKEGCEIHSQAWDEFCELENTHAFSPRQLRQMRTWVRQIVS